MQSDLIIIKINKSSDEQDETELTIVKLNKLLKLKIKQTELTAVNLDKSLRLNINKVKTAALREVKTFLCIKILK